jgi:hypothetical protein
MGVEGRMEDAEDWWTRLDVKHEFDHLLKHFTGIIMAFRSGKIPFAFHCQVLACTTYESLI